jgi:hypothetical protein
LVRTAIHVSAFVFLASLASATCANAQQGDVTSPPYYISPEGRFAVIFPSDPTIAEGTYTAQDGMEYPATRYSLMEDGNTYQVTVVDTTTGPAVDEGMVEYAVTNLKNEGELIYESDLAYEPGVGSRQLMVSLNDGSQIQAAIYMWDHRLYVSESRGMPGTPAVLRFAQSIVLLGPDGGEVNFNADEGEGPAR